MNFNKHYNILDGMHAFLGASKYHWINYDDDKLEQAFFRERAKKLGTELHEFAAHAIKLKQRLPRSEKTLNKYVNDAIGFKMMPEQILYYSNNCFGTADAISFKKNLLRIHDLKTGVSKTSIKQLEIYMALFCLEYHMSPLDIEAELRIYQLDQVLIHTPDPEDILYIIEKIKRFDERIELFKMEA